MVAQDCVCNGKHFLLFQSESVDLAMQILDGYDVRGFKINVEKAKFEQKGQFDPKKRGKKLSNKEKKDLKERQQK